MNLDETNLELMREFRRLRRMVISKNLDYNNSLQNPTRVFSRGNVIDGIMVRIDDKLNRIKAAGLNENTIDTVDDIVGYLVHLRIAYNSLNR
jgi:hypothetical protein